MFKQFFKNICEDCGEEFDEDYKFSPLCLNELKKESILKKKLKRTIPLLPNGIAKRYLYLIKRYFYLTTFFRNIRYECFKWKDYLDSKLASDFMELNSETPKRLSFKETYSIFILKQHGKIVRAIIKFFPE